MTIAPLRFVASAPIDDNGTTRLAAHDPTDLAQGYALGDSCEIASKLAALIKGLLGDLSRFRRTESRPPDTPGRNGESMVKISDKTDYSRFVRPTGEDEGIWLDHVEVHLVTHPVGQVKEMHVHDPPQDHVIVVRSGQMRWTVEDQTLDAEPGDAIVTPAGTAHGYEVLGDEPARVVCVDSPTRPKPG